MKKYAKTLLWTLLSVVVMGLGACGEKDTASRYTENDLLGNWRYYYTDILNPGTPIPGMTLTIERRNKAVVDGQPMHWTYAGDVFTASREEGSTIRWVQFKVLDIDTEQSIMSVTGAHGFCDNVAGTEWNLSRMEGHSWNLEQPGFFARI